MASAKKPRAAAAGADLIDSDMPPPALRAERKSAGSARARRGGNAVQRGRAAWAGVFLYRLAITLWVGSLLTVGYLVAPSLFGMLSSNRALAGEIAGLLFSRGAWVGIGCAAFLLIFLTLRQRAAVWKNPVFWVVSAMLALTLLGQFGVQPVLAQLKDQAKPLEVMKSVFADRFATWHGISSVLYLVQTVCGLLLLGVQARGLRQDSFLD